MRSFSLQTRYFITCLFCMGSPGFLHAQQNIHGSVTDIQGNPIPSANVLLLKNTDSVLVKGVFTNETGVYSFQRIPIGKYYLLVTCTGFEKSSSPVFEVNSDKTANVATLVLNKEILQLADVTVKAKKPLLEQKIDRLVINVANSITSAGNTALEVLERSPGVVVDHQNNTISMNGKDGVVLMINGKITHMPITAAVQMLSGMSSGNIEKIELITTPPASLDAAGNAGFINIVLKTNENVGTNGSFSITAGDSRGFVSAGNLNFNHRKGRTNLYGDLSASGVKKPFTVSGYNRSSNDQVITTSYFSTDRKETISSYDGRLGMDYQAGKKTVMGILLSGYFSDYRQTEKNASELVKDGQTDSAFILSNKETSKWNNFAGNINLQHNFKKEGETLTANLDYIYYFHNQPMQYFTTAYNGAGDFIYESLARTGKRTPISLWVAALDYTRKISKTVNLEAGIKQTISLFDNDVSFEKLQQGDWIEDPSLTARYKLREDYSAAYASLNITLGAATELKTGLRYEHTNSNLGTATVKNIVDRHYGNLFPSLFLSHKLTDGQAISFSYTKRITRPTFNALAPFTYYANNTNMIMGNAALQAAISNTVKANYTIKKYLFSLAYSFEKNAITGFQPQSDSVTNKVIFSPQNLVNLKTISATFSMPLTVTPWWDMQFNISGFLHQANALYKGSPVRLQQAHLGINGVESFKLPGAFSVELSGFYQSAQLDGISRRKPFGTLDAGVKKTFTGKKGSLLFTAGNIFKTLSLNQFTDLRDQNFSGELHIMFAQRTYKLTYTRSFGNNNLKEKRARSTGAEEEKGRVQ